VTEGSLPLFPVTMVGSWPRPLELLRAQREVAAGRMDPAGLGRVADAAVLDLVRLQERIGLDLITDGEQRRDNFYSFVAEKLSGVRLMTLAEMLEVVDDRAGFEEILRTLDVPAYSISNPTCVDRISRRHPLALGELEFVQRHSRRPVKVPLPGPYLLTRSMFVPELTRAAYATKEDLADDVVRVLREEIEDLVRAGAAFIQLDEPVLTELVFTQGRTRTFMCAALAARKDPAEELELAVDLVNRVVRDFDHVRIGLHVCRGNWSRDESTLLRGGYGPLRAYFDRMQVRQLVLEYATERAGELVPVGDKELGLGVVNPRTDRVETTEEIRASIERALQSVPAGRLFLNPDCGFATFSRRPVSTSDFAAEKLRVLVETAAVMRTELAT
jgi:5-methyltetrahydropteroyltriglutamate--homocysteine methyltransferase